MVLDISVKLLMISYSVSDKFLCICPAFIFLINIFNSDIP